MPKSAVLANDYMPKTATPVSIKEESTNLITKPIETLAKSGKEYLEGIFTAIGHPIQTVKAIVNTATGFVEKVSPAIQALKKAGVITEELPQEKYATAMMDFYKNRYGSLENVQKTVLEDPVGFMADASIFLQGVGGVLRTSGSVGLAGKVSSISRAVDPISGLTKIVGKGLETATKGKRIAPFAGKVDAEAVKAAQEAGLILPASAKSTSRVVPAVESIANKGFWGDRIIKKVDAAQMRLNNYADEIISQTGKAPDLSTAGKAIFDGAEKYRQSFIQIKNELYNKAIIPAKNMPGEPLITVNPEKTIDFLTTILNDKKRAATLLGKSTDLGYFQNLKNKFSRKPTLPDNFYADKFKMYTVSKSDIIKKAQVSTNVNQFVNSLIDEIPNRKYLEEAYNLTKKTQVSARELHSAIKELNNKISNFNDPITTGNKASLKKLTSLMSEDLDNAIISQRPELSEALNKANDFYSQGIKKLNSAFGENIKKFGEMGQYDKIIPSIASNSLSVEDIPKIFEIIGKENVPHLQAAYLEELFRKSRSNGNFTPQGITTQIKSFGGDEKLAALLSPEQFRAVKNIEIISKGLGKAEKVSSGSQTAFLVRIFAEVSTFTHNPIGAFKLLVGDMLFSKFVSSKIGQDILSEGITLSGRTGKSIQNVSVKTGSIPNIISKAGTINEETQ